MKSEESLLSLLDAPTSAERLDALRELMELERSGKIPKPVPSGTVNNHIHTIYSFSPYSPSKALWLARAAGLGTGGIMDHDSVGGCPEFVRAGEITGMAATCGFECRVSMKGTPFEGRRINNPDQLSVAYVAAHGIPHQNFAKCEAFLAPLRKKRNERNRRMVERLNAVIGPCGLSVDFDRDVLPLSQTQNGGSVTERHILFALAKRITAEYGRGEKTVRLLTERLHMSLSPKVRGFLEDAANPYYEYDLLGAMKSGLVAAFYVDAGEECAAAAEFVAFAKSVGAVSAYAYLGDVGDSVTGDKKAQKFEDDYLDGLFDWLEAAGFSAVTYMPSRNTLAQLRRVMDLCARHSLFEISGEDINTPRQSFICEALRREEFCHLAVSTWALIGHEREATRDVSNGMFSPETVRRMPDLKARAEEFAAKAKKA